MPHHLSARAEEILRSYFHAKDENRPHVLASVFTEGAVLQVHNRSSAIAFPAVTQGRDAIADVLVRNFGQTYENVYSFYMTRPTVPTHQFSCDWLVGMSDKGNRTVRVGCGRYDWLFEEKSPHLASHLNITIEVMQVLPADELMPVLEWFEKLTYPWSSPAEATESAPGIRELNPILQYIGRGEGDA